MTTRATKPVGPDASPHESGSPSAITAPPADAQRPRTGALASLHNPDYRLFFGGAMISNTGMWMQTVAQGWLVVSLTTSEFYVGLVSFFAMVPNLLFSLFGGVLADRVDKRRILILSQVVSALLIAVTATLIRTETIQLWQLMALSFGTGTMMALSSPSWQAIVPEIVGKEGLLNAIALNSAQFNLTRIVGPSLGGLLIRFVGIAGVYYLNALSYVGFLAAMLVIRPRYAAQRRVGARPESVYRSLDSAMRYVVTHRVIRTVLILAMVQTVFVFPYTTLLPVFAKDVLGLQASGYGVLLTAAGLGAFTGALVLAFRGEPRSRVRVMLGGQVIFALAVALFALSTWLPLSILALYFVGWSLVAFLATGNTLVQTLVPDEMRGRVMSIWMLAGFGLMPIGSLQAGFVASVTSPTFALVAGSAITLGCTFAVLLREREVFRRAVQGDPASV